MSVRYTGARTVGRRRVLFTGAAAAGTALLAACAGRRAATDTPQPSARSDTAVAASPIMASQETASYKVVLGIGPVENMLTPDQAKGATSGEVMAPMPGMAMPTMVMTDHGQPVNHHLEVHLTTKATGAVVMDQLPLITITDVKGMSRTLDSMAMYGVTTGMSDWHYGNNVSLPDGTYMIGVQVGNEQTVFKGLAVTG